MVVLNPMQRLKSSGVVAGFIAKDEDNDCVVLDGDPDKPVAIENDSGADSDDLLGLRGGVKREKIFTNKVQLSLYVLHYISFLCLLGSIVIVCVGFCFLGSHNIEHSLICMVHCSIYYMGFV
ncbi:unnamed protein product [Ilex paraguariensis]|uniref:Uncharacterized protein n=1 Tax=Ilex paraguariensis TaxID=185542 RepID=A0ABC8S0G5_9AQUA